MLLGEFEHTIDDKNRLTLPAKFRQALSGGLVVTRGMDGCLYSYPAGGLGAARRGPARRARPAQPRGPPDAALLLRRRVRGRARQAGPRDAAGALAKHAGLGREVVVAGVHDHLEIWDRAAWRDARQGSRRERGGCCRTSCGPTRLTTSPSSPTRCASCSPCSRARPSSTPPSAPAATPRCSPPTCTASGKLIAIDRDPSVRAVLRRACASARGVAGALPARRVLDRARRSSPRTACRPTRSCSTSASRRMQIDRPERGFSYATDAPLDMRMDPAAERLGARARQRGRRARADADLPPLRRGALRAADRARDRAPARASSRSSAPASSSRRSRRRSRRPARFGEGHPAKRVFQALRIAVNDELGQLEAALPAALEMLRPGRPARRDQLPLARGPDRQALLARARARLHLPARLPGLRLRPRAGAPRVRAGRPADAARARRQPARRLGAAARRGQERARSSAVASWSDAAPRFRSPRPRSRPRPKPRAEAPAAGAPRRRRRRRLDRRSSPRCSPASSRSTSPSCG